MNYALTEIEFDFVPSSLPTPDVAGENPDQITANDIYRQAHKMVYNAWPKNDLGKHWQAAVANARTAQMDFKTFCLYVIVGFKLTHEHTPFFPVNLSATSSPEKLECFRKACKRKFNSTDAKSLGLMLNLDFYDIDEEMLTSEIAFGRYLTGLVEHGHTDDLAFYVYDHDEISFSPYWLAIEETYQSTVFGPYVAESMKTHVMEKHKLGTAAQLRHRHLVGQVIGALKRRSHLASTIFTSRSRVMPNAVKFVLRQRGLSPDTPISDVKIVNNAYEFWCSVGSVAAARRNELL